jgi:hypothetical protein
MTRRRLAQKDPEAQGPHSVLEPVELDATEEFICEADPIDLAIPTPTLPVENKPKRKPEKKSRNKLRFVR